jgi:hypothetical protein
MREIKFIDRPEVLDPCPDCKQVEVCARCKSEIAEVVWMVAQNATHRSQYVIAWKIPASGKNWWGE